MKNSEKERVQKAIENAMSDAISEIHDILDRYGVVIVNADVNAIASTAIKMIELKIG